MVNDKSMGELWSKRGGKLNHHGSRFPFSSLHLLPSPPSSPHLLFPDAPCLCLLRRLEQLCGERPSTHLCWHTIKHDTLPEHRWDIFLIFLGRYMWDFLAGAPSCMQTLHCGAKMLNGTEKAEHHKASLCVSCVSKLQLFHMWLMADQKISKKSWIFAILTKLGNFIYFEKVLGVLLSSVCPAASQSHTEWVMIRYKLWPDAGCRCKGATFLFLTLLTISHVWKI